MNGCKRKVLSSKQIAVESNPTNTETSSDQASLVALIENTEDTDCESSSAGSQMRVIDEHEAPTLATCSFSGANRTLLVLYHRTGPVALKEGIL